MMRRDSVSPWLATVLLGAAPAQAGLRQELLTTPAPATPAATKAAPAPAKAPAEKAPVAEKAAPAPARAPAAEKAASAPAKAPAAEKAPAKAPSPMEGAAPARPRKRERPLPLAEQVRILSGRVEALQSIEARLKALSTVEARLAQLEGEARDARDALRQAQLAAAAPWQALAPTVQVAPGVRLHLRGYADIGLFVPLGDRLSFVRDEGLFFPERRGDAWTVFVGDPWAVPVNAQGDAAALVSSTSSGVRPDSIAVPPRPSFLANMGNVGLLAALGEQVHVGLNLNIEPRSGQLGSPGDLFALDLVYALWRPLRGRDLEIYAGKMESNFGVEWRTRLAPDRVGVTPSLLSRFTVGTPIGLRVRGTTLGVLGYDLALTNGGTTTERFGQLHAELDRNIFKSASARLSLGKAFLAEDTNMGLPFFLEVGASGQVGAQDGQPSDDVIHWQIGADVRAAVGGLGVRFEALHVSANGDRAPGAPWVRASGLYAEASYQLRCVQALLRFDLLRGEIASAGDLYLMDSARVSAALRVDITRHVLGKLEYQHYEDRGPADVRGDLLTSALVLRF